MQPAARKRLIVGTAGHIDHGKSRLVTALTGTDPDRLPEERARGMTIDLGFAHFEADGCDVYLVDVPGHERFLRNMVAGATGIDLALLVVAADDSVMPQTREHAEVLSLLGVRNNLLVINKIDLVDPAWTAQVEEEAVALLETLGLPLLGTCRVSAMRGDGVEELRRSLTRYAAELTALNTQRHWFRMPIDRVFVAPGRGVVVTGAVAHGATQRSDTLELSPAGLTVRVRDLQTHGQRLDAAAGRLRLAVNLAGVELGEVRRGDTLATPGYLTAGRRIEVNLARCRALTAPSRRRLRVLLHVGTAEVGAELRLTQTSETGTLRDAPAQLIPDEPLATAWGDRFILRDAGGAHVLGGGMVLRPVAHAWTRLRPLDPAAHAALSGHAPAPRVEHVVRGAGWALLTAAQLAASAGCADEEHALEVAQSLTKAQGPLIRFDNRGAPVFLDQRLLATTGAFLNERLRRFMAANPRAAGVPLSAWVSWMPRACPEQLRPALADYFIRTSQVAVRRDHVLPRDHVAALTAADQALYDALLAELHAGAFQPPAPSQLAARTPANARRADQLLKLAHTRGDLVRVSDDVSLHADRHAELLERVRGWLREHGEITVGQLRDLLQSSRKWIVPIAEHLDSTGLTQRSGDVRRLRPERPAGTAPPPANGS